MSPQPSPPDEHEGTQRAKHNYSLLRHQLEAAEVLHEEQSRRGILESRDKICKPIRHPVYCSRRFDSCLECRKQRTVPDLDMEDDSVTPVEARKYSIAPSPGAR